MDINAATALARKLMNEHGLSDWHLALGSAERRMGSCHYRTTTIRLSRLYIAAAEERQVRNTILHEIAHALVGAYVVRGLSRVRSGHGPEWKKKAIEIGCDGKRCGENPYYTAKREAAAEASAAAPHRNDTATGEKIGENAWSGSHTYSIPTARYGDVITGCGLTGTVMKVGRTRYQIDTTGNGQANYTIPFTSARFVLDEHGNRKKGDSAFKPIVTSVPVSRPVAPRASTSRPTFQPRDRVKVNYPGSKYHGVIGTVDRVNKKTISVTTANGPLRATPSLLVVM
ncbi:SprT-like domain-containing protein [Agromyces sp. NPDC057679]|uniref:SprT-like domain-containing protein n=1 Tax=Agromyces sp. NPDC057679 TaxID=3346207 RepID=UPI00366AEF16